MRFDTFKAFIKQYEACVEVRHISRAGLAEVIRWHNRRYPRYFFSGATYRVDSIRLNFPQRWLKIEDEDQNPKVI